MLPLEELRVYQLAMTIGDDIWNFVHAWDNFSKNTIGQQIVRAADSIAANISEGNGRYHFKENIRFCYIARGSLSETKTWLTKAQQRGLINLPDYDRLLLKINELSIKLNNYIAATSKQIDKP
ncbi:MAG: four helix bundle protein [Runella slithyformis]|jgi:four helix bundle protein|nr:MAG: four helix bundle protein [Runella slithyformis]TAE98598.1 MAG: four helix bundle protein [Runella slithyformis]TAF24405.1 MAG: four helix bundle protein [Runella slithyformis]TAF49382.1 MAG: four helix bundle protein [Runella slithyformis]TAF79194.1 MAG: four helix bundle protein [Runella slithyformis]